MHDTWAEHDTHTHLHERKAPIAWAQIAAVRWASVILNYYYQWWQQQRGVEQRKRIWENKKWKKTGLHKQQMICVLHPSVRKQNVSKIRFAVFVFFFACLIFSGNISWTTDCHFSFLVVVYFKRQIFIQDRWTEQLYECWETKQKPALVWYLSVLPMFAF